MHVQFTQVHAQAMIDSLGRGSSNVAHIAFAGDRESSSGRECQTDEGIFQAAAACKIELIQEQFVVNLNPVTCLANGLGFTASAIECAAFLHSFLQPRIRSTPAVKNTTSYITRYYYKPRMFERPIPSSPCLSNLDYSINLSN